MGDSDATECTPCPPGSTTLAPGSTECVLSTCPAGQFVDGNGCSGCPAGTFQPFFATTATECPQCPVGEASESGASECAPCSPLQTTSGPGSTECIDITCPFGEELVISGGSASCVPIICNAGQFVDGNGCSDCPAGTFQPDIGSTATKCQQCLVGEISGERAGTCLACPPGETTSGPGSTECVPVICAAGFLVDGDDCLKCIPGTFQPDNESTATECPQCPVGETSGNGASACDACPAGQTTSGPGSTKCVDITCPAGEELVISGGSASCVPITCNAGQFVDGNGCADCPEGFTSEGGTATECTPITCDAGQFFDGSECTDCAANTFQPDNGSSATQCQQCPGGTRTITTGSDCFEFFCSAGSFAQGNACADCPAGTFQPDTGIATPAATECQLCPVGETSAEGAGACDACPPGQTTSAPGSTECVDITCPAGEELVISGGSASCVPITCNAGQFRGDKACELCPPGEFQPKENFEGTDCEQCPVDTFSSSEGAGACEPCPIGQSTATSVGQAECIDFACPRGFFISESTNKCERCPSGTFQPNKSFSGTECQLCPVGEIPKSEGTSCTACPPGETTDGPGSTTCIPVTCDPGQFVDGNGCANCPEGFTSEGGTATECTPIVIKGCTDKDAINFKSDATEDDGTCIFLNVAKAGGESKVYGIGPHSQVTSGNGAFALRNRNSGTDLSISNSATWASSGLFGEAAGDSGAEAMTGVPLTSVAKSYSDAIMTNYHYNPVGKANSFFSGQGTSKRSPIEIASGADVSIVTPHFAGSSSSIFSGVSKSDPSLQGTYADVVSRGGGALKYTAIDVGRPSFDHLHG